MIQRGPYRIHALTTWSTIFLFLLGTYIYFPLSWIDLSHLVWQGRVFRILAFGDSLTEGLHSWPSSPRFHPYTYKLESLLNEHIGKTNTSVYYLIRNEGKSGDRASVKMFSRLRTLLNETKQKFDLAIILAGTNDLVDVMKGNKRNYTVDTIANHVKFLHELCHQNGIVTMAVTIPETALEGNPVFENAVYFRKEINRIIKEYSLQNPSDVLFFDLAAAIPRENSEHLSQVKLWDDGLHFTRAGYDRMAEEIFLSLKKHMEKLLSGD